MEGNLNNLIPFSITEESEVLVSARNFHSFLETKTNFKQWYLSMIDYGFVEGEDYHKNYIKMFNTDGEQTVLDYMMSVDMAKEIALLQRSEKGKQARKYFINVEKKFKSAQVALSNLLEITRNTVRNSTAYTNYNKDVVDEGVDYEGYMIEPLSRAANSAPESDYTNPTAETTYRNTTANINENTTANTTISTTTNGTYINEGKRSVLNTNFRDTSKLLGVRENLLVNWLLLSNYCYRDKKGNIKPYAKFMDCFQMKEYSSESGHSGVQTLINTKGREYFKNLLINEKVIKETQLLE